MSVELNGVANGLVLDAMRSGRVHDVTYAQVAVEAAQTLELEAGLPPTQVAQALKEVTQGKLGGADHQPVVTSQPVVEKNTPVARQGSRIPSIYETVWRRGN